MHSAHKNTVEGGCLTVVAAGPELGSTKFAARSLVLGSVIGLLLLAAGPVSAQDEAVLYNFPGYSNGQTPQASMIVDSKGNLYGTTTLGGVSGYGTIFEVTLPPTKAPKERVRHSFPMNSNPMSNLTFDSAGNLYGTTVGGGIKNKHCPAGCGVVFELTAAGKYTVLYKFKGGYDGAYPYGGVVVDDSGNVYGTTKGGGQDDPTMDCGTVFQLSGGVETQLYVFYGIGDGCYPLGGLVMDSYGNLYGTTQGGGAGYGTVFESDTFGDLTTIHYFASGADGAYPLSGVVMDDFGFLYGATQQGGGSGCGGYGCGMVYEIDPTIPKEYRLYSFAGGPSDGAYPYGALAVDSSYNLYGTTYGGGTGGNGTVFELQGLSTEKLLYSFGVAPDGSNPVGGVVLGNDGHIYGTTSAGGSSNRGTVFYVIPGAQ
jgi:uncharacterized repeat protein (TIGR03803 family)